MQVTSGYTVVNLVEEVRRIYDLLKGHTYTSLVESSPCLACKTYDIAFKILKAVGEEVDE